MIATYWLGLLSYDDGKYDVAATWFAKPALVAPDSPYAAGARYNLARSLEAQHKFDEAIPLLEDDTSPQQHGNRLRARDLKLREKKPPKRKKRNPQRNRSPPSNRGVQGLKTLTAAGSAGGTSARPLFELGGFCNPPAEPGAVALNPRGSSWLIVPTSNKRDHPRFNRSPSHAFARQPTGAEGGLEIVAADETIEVQNFPGQE